MEPTCDIFGCPLPPPEAELRPLIRFSGGKTWLVPFVRAGIRCALMAREGARYVEPFFGGGAVGLHIGWPKTIAGDLAPGLIGLYRAAQAAPEAVAEASAQVVAAYAGQDTSEAPGTGYYGARREFNSDVATPARRAALLLYLVQRGYNGLYRVGPRGWNVPQGKDSSGAWLPAPAPYDADRLAAFAQATHAWTFVLADFQATIAETRRGDVIFCDPPYASLPDGVQRAKMFTGYCPGGFGPGDQKRLAESLAWARDQGVVVVHTNSDTPEVRALYRGRGFWLLPTAELRAISRDGEGRARKSCVLITSHPEVVEIPEDLVGRSGAATRRGKDGQLDLFAKRWLR